ncbi:MAG: hypothetical protein JF584_18670, partial [Acidobacteria bacterium]|nr:hypothetical protein [Acidobacteriota bacterium]
MPNVLYEPGFLAGDYIPNLVAAAPDSRALDAISDQLLSDNQAVAELAASALQVFPQEEVNVRLRELIHTKGSSDVLAHFVHDPSLREYRSQFVADSIRFLDSSDPKRVVAAIETLGFLVHTPNWAPSNVDLNAADT